MLQNDPGDEDDIGSDGDSDAANSDDFASKLNAVVGKIGKNGDGRLSRTRHCKFTYLEHATVISLSKTPFLLSLLKCALVVNPTCNSIAPKLNSRPAPFSLDENQQQNDDFHALFLGELYHHTPMEVVAEMGSRLTPNAQSKLASILSAVLFPQSSGHSHKLVEIVSASAKLSLLESKRAELRPGGGPPHFPPCRRFLSALLHTCVATREDVNLWLRGCILPVIARQIRKLEKANLNDESFVQTAKFKNKTSAVKVDKGSFGSSSSRNKPHSSGSPAFKSKSTRTPHARSTPPSRQGRQREDGIPLHSVSLSTLSTEDGETSGPSPARALSSFFPSDTGAFFWTQAHELVRMKDFSSPILLTTVSDVSQTGASSSSPAMKSTQRSAAKSKADMKMNSSTSRFIIIAFLFLHVLELAPNRTGICRDSIRFYRFHVFM